MELSSQNPKGITKPQWVSLLRIVAVDRGSVQRHDDDTPPIGVAVDGDGPPKMAIGCRIR